MLSHASDQREIRFIINHKVMVTLASWTVTVTVGVNRILTRSWYDSDHDLGLRVNLNRARAGYDSEHHAIVMLTRENLIQCHDAQSESTGGAQWEQGHGIMIVVSRA